MYSELHCDVQVSERCSVRWAWVRKSTVHQPPTPPHPTPSGTPACSSLSRTSTRIPSASQSWTKGTSHLMVIFPSLPSFIHDVALHCFSIHQKPISLVCFVRDCAKNLASESCTNYWGTQAQFGWCQSKRFQASSSLDFPLVVTKQAVICTSETTSKLISH